MDDLFLFSTCINSLLKNTNWFYTEYILYYAKPKHQPSSLF